jgi:hypothetical protein
MSVFQPFDPRVSSMAEELFRLNRTHARMKWLCLACIASTATLAVFVFVLAVRVPVPIPSKSLAELIVEQNGVLVVRRLVVIDPAGTVRAELATAGRQRAGLAIYDAAGSPRVSLVTEDNGSASLLEYDDHAKPRVHLSADTEPELSMTGRDGNSRIVMWADDESASFRMNTSDRLTRFDFGVREDSLATMNFYGAENQIVQSLGGDGRWTRAPLTAGGLPASGLPAKERGRRD